VGRQARLVIILAGRTALAGRAAGRIRSPGGNEDVQY
jgi:hypothetical protein